MEKHIIDELAELLDEAFLDEEYLVFETREALKLLANLGLLDVTKLRKFQLAKVINY